MSVSIITVEKGIRMSTEHLPVDVNMLMSVINMKLRDHYNTLEELCKSEDIDEVWLLKRLEEGGFEYNKELNKFW